MPSSDRCGPSAASQHIAFSGGRPNNTMRNSVAVQRQNAALSKVSLEIQ